MKLDKTLIQQMRSAIKMVKEAVDNDLNIEDKMEEIDTSGFKKKITVDRLPQSIQSVLKFPYISNINVIDRITLNEYTNQVMIQFKIAFKKLSDLFITKAVQNGLISANKSENKDRIISMGTNNLRMILVIQLLDGIKNDTKPEDDDIDLDNVELDDEESGIKMKNNPDYKMSELKESPNWWNEQNKIENENVELSISDLVKTVYSLINSTPEEIKSVLRKMIDPITIMEKRNLYYVTGAKLSSTPNEVTTEQVVDNVYNYATGKLKTDELRESEVEEIISYPSVNAFQQAMSNIAMIISQSVTDAVTDEEKKEIKEIWNETSKELNNLIKGIY